MGTLGNQTERAHCVCRYFNVVAEALDVMGIDRELATPQDWIAASAIVQAAHAVLDGDYRDEQAGGFGDLAERLISVLDEMRVQLGGLDAP